jgi:hypothetical protein
MREEGCVGEMPPGGRMVGEGRVNAAEEEVEAEGERKKAIEDARKELVRERGTGLRGTRSGERRSWIWSKQSSQTRASMMGDVGDSNSFKGVLRGGWRKERWVVSRSVMVRDEHGWQKTPPHLRQWCLRSHTENGTRQEKFSQ